jgi:hypothetical protein
MAGSISTWRKNMKHRLEKIFRQPHFFPVAIGCIVLISALLRVYNVAALMPWDADAGRDVLVAKHIIQFDDNKFTVKWRAA